MSIYTQVQKYRVRYLNESRKSGLKRRVLIMVEDCDMQFILDHACRSDVITPREQRGSGSEEMG